MIAGEERARITLASPAGDAADVAIIAAEATPANTRAMTQVGQLWLDQSEAADEGLGPLSDEAYRAYFASTTAYLAADRLAAGTCCVLVAEDAASGEVLGVAVYTPGTGDWYIDDFTVSPRNQPGFPAAVQLRGIGSAMLSVLAGEAAAEPSCTSISLLPLDEAAECFWSARGFHRTDPRDRLRLTCEEVGEIAARSRVAGPDCPDAGDCVTAGDWSDHRRAAPPRVVGRVYPVGR